MVKNVRITYRRRHSYATRSNGIKAVKTPGMCTISRRGSFGFA
jgi:ribosomal protein L34E